MSAAPPLAAGSPRSAARADDTTLGAARLCYVLRLGDTSLVLGQRLGEWIGQAPALEEELALANLALDLVGQARLLLGYAGELEGAGRDEDALAFLRDAPQFFNLTLAEQPNGDFAHTIVRQWLIDSWQLEIYQALALSADTRLAAIAAKAVKETRYHHRFSSGWLVRLGDGTAESRRRAQRSLDDLWALTEELFTPDAVDERASAAGIAPPLARARAALVGAHRSGAARGRRCSARRAQPYPWHGKRGVHSEHLGHMLGGDAAPAAHLSGCALVTAEPRGMYSAATAAEPDACERQVWELLASVPDPEIPVLSIVDLGIVRHVRREGDGRAARRPDADLFRLPGDRGDPRHGACRARRGRLRRCDSRRGAVAALDERLADPGGTGKAARLRHRPARGRGRESRPPRRHAPPLSCPRCGSRHSERLSEFGSTPCKAHYRCGACGEPFDYFKCL